jgi:integrase
VSVTDRWHKTYPKPGDEPCRDHSRGRTKLYPAAEHLLGDRWQVRWHDPYGKQRSKNFALKEGKNPDLHADAFDTKIAADLLAGTYIDPEAARETFGKFAVSVWLKNQGHDKDTTGAHVEGLLRNHVLEDAANPGSGLTPGGAPALGQHPWAKLQRHPSLTGTWMTGLRLAPSSATQVVRIVSSVFIAAMDDGLITRNPTMADSVKKNRPKWVPRKAAPWMPATVDAVAEGLARKEERFGIIPYLGAGTGMRQGEMFGLAETDVGDPEFFRRQLLVHVRVQVRLVRGQRCFAPLKNQKEHAVPVPPEWAEMLIAYMERFPPVAVTLPWKAPGQKPVTRRLIVTRPDRRAVQRNVFNEDFWKPALAHAGIIPPREPGGRWAEARDDGCHRLRHTAVSHWLNDGTPVEAVAEWIGDSVEMVYKTYAHMVPGAEDKGRAAMAKFFAKLGASARFVPSGQRAGDSPQVVALSRDFV